MTEKSQKIFLKGKGVYLRDIEGNDYVDYHLNNGSLILGHAPRNVVLAAKKYAERGIALGVPTKAQNDLEKYLVQTLGLCEEACLVSSDNEAVMRSIYLARKWTNRNKVIAFEGHDIIQSGLCEDVLVLPLNDVQAFEQAILNSKDAVAAVILDVLSGLEVDAQFVKNVRELIQQNGIVLICDERNGGFRSKDVLAHRAFGIEADIICLGGVLGAGFSLGAVGGKSQIINGFKSMPVSSAVSRASLMTLYLCDERFYKKFDQRCEQFAKAMNDFFKIKNVSVELLSFHSMMRLRCDESRLCEELPDYCLSQGIYFPRNPSQTFFLSWAHTARDLNKFIHCLEKFFK